MTTYHVPVLKCAEVLVDLLSHPRYVHSTPDRIGTYNVFRGLTSGSRSTHSHSSRTDRSRTSDTLIQTLHFSWQNSANRMERYAITYTDNKGYKVYKKARYTQKRVLYPLLHLAICNVRTGTRPVGFAYYRRHGKIPRPKNRDRIGAIWTVENFQSVKRAYTPLPKICTFFLQK